MISLDTFQIHINSLSKDEWQELFKMLPDLEQDVLLPGNQDDSNAAMDHIHDSKLVIDVLRVITQLKLCPVFDWTSWEEGKLILKNLSTDYSKLEVVTLCKLLTCIIRADRFNEGFLMACFERGIILNIIKALEIQISTPGEHSKTNPE